MEKDRADQRPDAQGRSLPVGPAGALIMLTLPLLALLMLVSTVAFPGAGVVALATGPALLTTVAGVAAYGLATGYPHDRFGACNTVTLIRAALAAGLAVPLVAAGAPMADAPFAWAVVAVAACALCLDGLDGWLARQSGLASAFGARFDMEVDALLGAILSLLALTMGKAGVWVLALGFLRYAFAAAGLVLPWLTRDLPPRMGRKTVCVIQIATLTALLAPPLQPPLSPVLAAMATALLIGSFGTDVLWLWRRR